MLNKSEYIEKNLDFIALRYFKESQGETKEEFIDKLYEEYKKLGLLQEAKAGDKFYDVIPKLLGKEIILENIQTITRDYVTVSFTYDGLKGSLRLSTEDIYSYVKGN